MAKLLALDYGAKRTGVAITDSLQIIASGLTTVQTKELKSFLKQTFSNETIETIVIGQANRWDGTSSDIESEILSFIKFLNKTYPTIAIERQDESFTSKLAMDSLISAGAKKMKRREKGLIDKVSATIILQAYMERVR